MQQVGGSGGGDQFPQGPLPARDSESQWCEETWVTRSISYALTFITFIPHPRPKCNISKLPSQRLCVYVCGSGGAP